jgi:hypothetical protein
MKDYQKFEEEIRQTYHLPEKNQQFFNSLETKLIEKEKSFTRNKKQDRAFLFSRSWAYAVVVVMVVLIAAFAIEPSRVLGQIKAAFGFLPQAGVVELDSAFRQLAQPVSDTKDGVTINVQSAFLSADQTVITYSVSEPIQAEDKAKFGQPACNMPPFLDLPDGAKKEASSSSGIAGQDGYRTYDLYFDSQIAPNINQATLVFPCQQGYATGKGPQDWKLNLAFSPVEEELVVYPLSMASEQVGQGTIDSSAGESSPQAVSETQSNDLLGIITAGKKTESMVMVASLEKEDAYWVTWAYSFEFDDDVRRNGYLEEIPFTPVLYDADGNEFPEMDHATRLELWDFEESLRRQNKSDELVGFGWLVTFEIPKSNTIFPVYAKQNMIERSFPEKEAYVDIEFDADRVINGNEPLEMNLPIQIGSVTFVLDSISKNEFGGFSFNFDGSDGKVVQCDVEVLGAASNMRGSSGYNIADPYHFYQAQMFAQIPGGIQTVRISQPAVAGEEVSVIGTWSPGE